jgi:hypothetical protein
MQEPVRQLDVRALGYMLQKVRGELETHGDRGSRICFPSQRQIIVAFVTPRPANVKPELAPRGEPSEALAYRLHALFVDAVTGKVQATHEWPTSSKWAWITRAPEGKFVVITPERLTLYSPAIEEIKHLDLPITQESIKEEWRVGSSTGGHYLVVDYASAAAEREGDPENRREWIDTETMQVLREWTINRGSPEYAKVMSISDDGKTALVGYNIGPPEGPFHRLCKPSPSQPYCGGTTMIANDTVLGVTSPYPKEAESMYLIRIDGDVVLRQDSFKGESYRRWATSVDGHRIAFALDMCKGGSAAFDIAPHCSLSRVIVYDMVAHRWIYSLDGKQQHIKSISGLALSPDGSLLTLINQDGILQMYRVAGEADKSLPAR